MTIFTLRLGSRFGVFSKMLTAVTLVTSLTACSGRTGEGAAGGAAFGAGVGLLLGAIAGDPGKGLAAGVAIGGAQGAYEGWKQDQDDERTRQIVRAIEKSGTAPQAPATDPSSAARNELTRFVGLWRLEGWGQEPGGNRLSVSARANAIVEMNHFVRISYLDIELSGEQQTLWGETTLGYEPSSGYHLTSRFSSLSDEFRMTGAFDPATQSFVFTDAASRLSVQFQGPDAFTIETFLTTENGETQIESYEFRRL